MACTIFVVVVMTTILWFSNNMEASLRFWEKLNEEKFTKGRTPGSS